MLLNEIDNAIAEEQKQAIIAQQAQVKEAFVLDALQSKSLGVSSSENKVVIAFLVAATGIALYFFLKPKK